MIWAVTIIIIVLLFIYPKQTGLLLFVLLVGIGIVALIDYLVSYQKEKEQKLVSIAVSYVSSETKSVSIFSNLFFLNFPYL